MTTYKVTYSSELTHHGVKGQRWGIRRYQNFDGSYTKKGLERYYKSQDTYEKKKSEYKAIKKDKSASRYEKQYAKGKMKEAKRRADKDYKHLKQDKMGDEGKVLYAQGKRITNTAELNNFIHTISSLSAAAAIYGNQAGKIDTDTRNKVILGAAAAEGALFVKRMIDEIPNNKLRAYYSHTSNY